ncbi:hypothetical protein GN956_G17196 [Arapaima gigas]
MSLGAQVAELSSPCLLNPVSKLYGSSLKTIHKWPGEPGSPRKLCEDLSIRHLKIQYKSRARLLLRRACKRLL